MAKPKRIQKNATKEKSAPLQNKSKIKIGASKSKQNKQLKAENIKLALKENKPKTNNNTRTNQKELKSRKKDSANSNSVNHKKNEVKKTLLNTHDQPHVNETSSVTNSQPQRVQGNLKDQLMQAAHGSLLGRKRSLPSSAETRTVKKKKTIDRRSLRYQHVPGVALTLGQGDVGQLGLGESVTERKKPSLVALDNIVDVCAGGMHTVCLNSAGQVFTFGCNDEGALGRDTADEDGSEFLPGAVEIPGKVIQICAGDSHTAVLTEENHVYAWGTFRDSSGSMGLLTPNIQFKPQQLLPGIPVLKIASGSDHLVLLTLDGHLYTCGCAEQGQLGRVAECFSSRGGRKGLGLILNPGLVFTRRLQGKDLSFEDVWTGSYCTYAKVKDSGDIYVCGLNNYAQLCFDDMKNRFVLEKSPAFCTRQWQEIAGGQHHTLALDAAGQVYSIGRHEYGRLGLGENATEVHKPTIIPELEKITSINISCGECTSYSISEDGSIYAWGMGTNFALGTGEEDDEAIPVRMSGRQLENRKVVAVSGGGQHCVMLAVPKGQESDSDPQSEA